MNASNRKGTKSAIVICTKFLIQLMLSLSLLKCTSAQPSTCATQMANTVVYENSSTLFPKAIPSEAVQWQVAPSMSTQDSIQDLTNYDDKITAPFVTTPPSYAADQTGLTISKATVEPPSDSITFATAGFYVQNYQSGCSTAAGLVVIRSGPTCSLDTSNPDAVKLDCSVVYASYVNQQINPNMTWTNSSGAVVFQDQPARTALSNSNGGLQSATSHLPVTSGDLQTYGCQLTFTAPSTDVQEQIPFMATNAPSFTASCSVNNALVTTTTTTTAPAPSTSNPPLSSAPVVVLSTPSPAASNAPSTSTPTSTPSVPIQSTSSSLSPPSLSPPSSAQVVTAASSPSAGQSSLSSAPVTIRSTATTTSTSDNASVAKTLAIVLGLVLGSLAVAALVGSCWCLCCCQTPVGAKRGRQRRRRRYYYQTPYFSPWRYQTAEEET